MIVSMQTKDGKPVTFMDMDSMADDDWVTVTIRVKVRPNRTNIREMLAGVNKVLEDVWKT